MKTETFNMWRQELLHPMSIHFPIALLILGSCIFLYSVSVGERSQREFSERMSFYLILIGTLTSWFSIYTGSLAARVVTSMLCDVNTNISHKDTAYYATYIFTVFTFLKIFREEYGFNFRKIITFLLICLSVSGTALLIYTSHLGSSLVFQQGAGVLAPGTGCKK